jgi:predicted ester cyclase
MARGEARSFAAKQRQKGGKRMNTQSSVETAQRLAREFFRRVWAPPHDLDAINELMTDGYRITTAGQVVEGREAFKKWVAEMQKLVKGATNEHLDVFTNASGDRVVSRWICRGTNNGMFGLPANGAPVAFSGIAIWRVENGRLAECWVERSAWELYNSLRAT